MIALSVTIILEIMLGLILETQHCAITKEEGDVTINIQFLSSKYRVRDLVPTDAELVYEALKNNSIFYEYHPPMVTLESIIEDMEALPPNKGYEDKHYTGFSTWILWWRLWT